MDTPAYPGKGLSLSQLVLALKEELKHRRILRRTFRETINHRRRGGQHVDLRYSFTFGEAYRLHREVSSALVTIRGWRNSFIHVSRIPSKILSLIPTHFESQKDRFRVTFVRRHWRRIFLQNVAQWSQLNLFKGETYVKTLEARERVRVGCNFLLRGSGRRHDAAPSARVPVELEELVVLKQLCFSEPHLIRVIGRAQVGGFRAS